MKPGFALSLSFEGISLLHRAAGGWRSVGEVALDVPDLAAALAELRDKALRLSPEGISCKLIIPNDQIRYLTLDTGRAEGEARRAQVRAALDGATPYAVDELAFDLSVEGKVTHIAAVARETLAEAEAFAAEHAFNPVSFVAVPGDQPFLGEPFFGVAKQAGALQVEPDGIAVVVTGPAEIPDPAAAEDTAEEDTPPPADKADAAAAHPDTEAPPEPAVHTEAPEAAKTEPEAEAPPAPASDPTPPAVGFTSRRGKDHGDAAPRLSGASRDAVPDGGKPAPVAARGSGDRPTGKGPSPDLSAAPRASAAKPATATPVPGPDSAAKPSKARPGAATTALLGRAAALLNRRKADEAPTEPGDTPRITPIAAPPPAAEPPKDEAERMTVFGARQTQQVGGKPRHLGLILTLILLLFLAAVAAWAALFTDGGLARLFGPGDSPVIAAAPEPKPEAAPRQADQAAAPTPAPAPAQPPQTDTQPPEAPTDLAALPPGPGNETGAEDAPAPATAPDAPALTGTDSAVLDALREDPGITPPAPLDQAGLTSEQAPDPELEPEPEAAGEPAEADTETLYAATGIWPEAPVEPETPAIIGLDDLYVASIDRTDLSQDAVALPTASAFATDTSLGAVTSPAAAGTAFALDARGLVTPTPEGAVTPDGITVYLGPPPVVPPPTPARLSPTDDAAAEAEALRQRLAGFRPRPRPADLVEQSERVQLGGRSRAELGQLRPRLRPASAQDTAASDDGGEAPATAQAVASTLMPKPRPRDFQSIVRNSDRASIGIPENMTSAPQESTTVAPKIPTSASVARQATLDNAINLRQVNLIGVYGTASNRRALVRLPSGRYKKVKVGDRIDGGKVVAIGETQLRYQKGGRNHVLEMPSG